MKEHNSIISDLHLTHPNNYISQMIYKVIYYYLIALINLQRRNL